MTSGLPEVRGDGSEVAWVALPQLPGLIGEVEKRTS
jgi:hypothetical protein